MEQSLPVGADVFVSASVQHLDNGWQGARHLPAFSLPGTILGLASWDGAAEVAKRVMFALGVPANVTRVVLTLTADTDGAETATRAFDYA